MLPDAYDGDDFYCDVALPNTADLDVVHDSERVLAFHHTRPFWPVHLVVVPKRHLSSLLTVTADDEADIREMLEVVQRLAAEVTEAHGACRVLTNLGRYQDSKHLHVHVASGAPRWSVFGSVRRHG